MEGIIKFLSNPIIWGIVIFIAGVVVKKKLNAYLKIISLLIDAVEVIDKEIKDIVPAHLEAKLLKIKKWINARLVKGQAKIVDSILLGKGFLKKKEI